MTYGAFSRRMRKDRGTNVPAIRFSKRAGPLGENVVARCTGISSWFAVRDEDWYTLLDRSVNFFYDGRAVRERPRGRSSCWEPAIVDRKLEAVGALCTHSHANVARAVVSRPKLLVVYSLHSKRRNKITTRLQFP